ARIDAVHRRSVFVFIVQPAFAACSWFASHPHPCVACRLRAGREFAMRATALAAAAGAVGAGAMA
ncbi:MAG TPA: hypothetical protein PLB41_19950, partial [Rubrivivax sp.]|nr:hypothetical protein [Rubrivivax sp.]HPO21042.1 hypothetical protein [Rubrivivax sp.]